MRGARPPCAIQRAERLLKGARVTLLRHVIAACFAIVISGCATPYQEKGVLGGYEDQRLSENTAIVTFHGNEFISSMDVEALALRRAAELTIESGYDYFFVESGSLDIKNQSYQTTGQVRSTCDAFGNCSASYTPGAIARFQTPQSQIRLRMYKGGTPDEPGYYDAKVLLRYLGE